MDNSNTYSIALRYRTFDSQAAWCLAKRLEIQCNLKLGLLVDGIVADVSLFNFLVCSTLNIQDQISLKRMGGCKVNQEIKVLAISGSLRQKSSNTALMKATIGLAPEHMIFTVYDGLGDLPHFNPDLDIDEGPASVRELREQLKQVDGVLICTPEYGNGVPGALKNALDWLVSSGEFVNKPTAVISASPSPMGGSLAHASLLLTLQMINAEIVENGKVIIPHITLKLDREGVITNAETRQELQALLQGLEQACRG